MENYTEGSWAVEQILLWMQDNEENAALENKQYYRTWSVMEHAVLQNMQYYRTCSITEHEV